MEAIHGASALPAFSLRGWPARDLADPYPVYRRYREAAAVHRVEGPDGEPVYYVFDYAGVSQVLTDRTCVRADPARRRGPVPDTHPVLRDMISNWLVFLDPPRHSRLRALLSEEFTLGMVAGLRPRIATIA
ncbi:MAG TPA: hypothetical protein VE196_06510, partial [Pseudonocardiaceae bacterium]|nr:hypothetical protein [Pseudonocardiaceae bacterium]